MKKLFLFLFLFFAIKGFCQDVDFLKIYTLQPILKNTALGVQYKDWDISLLHSQQWTKPINANQDILSVIGHINKNSGIAVFVYSYKYAYLRDFALLPGYFYHINLNTIGNSLSFSVLPKLIYYTYDKNWFVSEFPNDPIFNNALKSDFIFSVDAGIHFQHNVFNTGISFRNLIPYKTDLFQKLQSVEFYIATSISNLTKTFTYQPNLLFRFGFSEPNVIYLENDFIIKQFLLLGLGYYETFVIDKFSSRSLNFLVKLTFKKKYYLGVNYDLYLSSLNSIFGPSYGIILGYRFVKTKKLIPSYF